MSGILFLKAQDIEACREFYISQMDCTIWLEQADCIILQHGNFLFGLCQRDRVQSDVMLTFFYESRAEVDAQWDRLQEVAEAKPVYNDKYDIYQFFARDPEGRVIECQYFEKPLAQFRTGGELLSSRRSVRAFTDRQVPGNLLETIWELCRFAPSGYNYQPVYFKPITDRKLQQRAASLHGDATAPIGRAPMAVAICVDTERSAVPMEDGCIATYHFMLAAWHFGLATCWIGGMNDDGLKADLGIPGKDLLVTVSPLGYPALRNPGPPDRKPASHFLQK